ncbi:MAG: HAMP domain-containing histidine kinase [Oscillospiraceae bacterium]|nr:HAMP domain-containing histidine kinase [Oscillospiraceae bacterium]
MIKKLRFKFILSAMLSLFIVLAVIIGVVNVFNYQSIVSDADSTLYLLEHNEGKFPARDKLPFEQRLPDGERPLSPELPYQSRFFSVVIDQNGNTISVDTSHIAAVDNKTAVLYAKRVVLSQNENGFMGRYRYLLSENGAGYRVIFLDCTKDLETFQTFLLSSVGISLLGLLAVFVLMVFLSARIVRPVSESYEKQKRFITDAGHEIKTPITIIDADAEVLESEIGESEWLSDIKSQTRRLAELTNNLIYLSRMQEGKTSIQSIDFPISDVVRETALSFNSRALTEQKELSVFTEPMLSFKGDEKAIAQLVSILVDNAIKYSDPESKIHLSLRKNGKNLDLSVYNKAANIQTQNLDRLFDRFYRDDPSRNSKTGGQGIGLSIAKAIAEAHGGKIVAWSPEKDMFCITVLLPM